MQFDAYYTDGQSAERRRVRVLLATQSLRISASGGQPLGEWPYAGLRLMEEVYRDQPVRLQHPSRGEATLTFDSAAILDAVRSQAGVRLRGASLLPRSPLAVALLSAVALAAVVAGIVLALPRLVEPLTGLVPERWEQALGEKVAAHLAQDHPFCEQAAGMAALEALTARLTATAETPYPFRVRVSSRPGVNAFAAPGGQIVILKDLLATAQTPEAVAGVLAHEIAHGLERHPLKGLLRAVGVQLLFNALIGDVTALDDFVEQFAQILLISSYTRADELAADRIGMALLNQAGIRGDGLVAFFQHMEAKQAGAAKVPQLLSTHPLTRERIELVESLAKAQGSAMSPGEWAALRAICG